MRGFKRSPWLFGLGVLLAIPVTFGAQANADVHTDQGGSLVIFPKVIADGSRDTIIKITNKFNMPTYAHCFYTNALGSCDSSPDSCLVDDDCPVAGDTCNVPCTVENFDIFLTAQQPTFWRVSTGRFADLTLPPCNMNDDCDCTLDANSGQISCPGFPPAAAGGFNSTAVLPRFNTFNGELRCFQTDEDSEPVSTNSLIGEAIIETIANGEQSQYNAITFAANQFVAGDPNVPTPSTGLNTDLDLELDNDEFNACPTSLVFTHYREGAADLASGATMSTELTLAPCSVMFETTQPVLPFVTLFTTDEMELAVSVDGVGFQCHFNQALSDISAALGANSMSTFQKTRIVVDSSNICYTGSAAGEDCDDDNDCPGFVTSSTGISLGCRPSSGVVGVAEQFYGSFGSSAWSLTNEGSRPAPGDIMNVPVLNP